MIKLDLAGVAESDLSVSVRDGGIEVSGVRRDRQVPEGSTPYAMEIAYSRFERQFDLDDQPRDVSIAVDRGMVLITVSCRDAAEARRER